MAFSLFRHFGSVMPMATKWSSLFLRIARRAPVRATAFLAAPSFLFASSASAQQIDDDYWIQAGVYFPDVDTEVSIAPPDDPDFKTLLDLESDLDLSDRDSLPSFTAGMRISEHWQIQGEFYTLKRSGTTSLGRDIIFDGVTYPVSASVSSGFDSDVYRLSVGYSFLRQPNLEIGASLGVHATNFDVFIEGEAQAGNAGVSTEFRQRELLAPLPTVGLYLMASPLPRIGLGAQVDYLSLKVGDYDGKLLNLQAEATYAITGNVRIGAMYRYVDYQVDIEKERYTGRVAYTFNGPAVFLEVGF